jgi:hypothetical protein
MSTYIALQDGRVWGASNGAYDGVLEALAEQVGTDEYGRELAAWLLDQRCEVCGPGVGWVDLRWLTDEARTRIVAAIPDAFRQEQRVHPGPERKLYLDSFAELIRMQESIARGEPPEALTSSWLTLDSSDWREERDRCEQEMPDLWRQLRGPGWD